MYYTSGYTPHYTEIYEFTFKVPWMPQGRRDIVIIQQISHHPRLRVQWQVRAAWGGAPQSRSPQLRDVGRWGQTPWPQTPSIEEIHRWLSKH